MESMNHVSSPEVCPNNDKLQTNIKVYKRRWIMLFLLVMCYTCTAYQFLQFSIIANIIVEYYDVSYEAVDWTAMIQFAFFIPFVFPAMHIINKIGVRASLLITMFGICTASWIKVASGSPDRFWVIIVAQAIIAVTQIFIAVLPARFAAAWFPQEETALACGVTIFGNQLGITLGCFVPTILVKYSQDKELVAYDMKVVNIGLAVICLVVLLLTFAFFRSEPPTPPSGAQIQLETIGIIQFKDSTVMLFKNKPYTLLFVAYAISIGVFFTIPTLLNQIILQYYQDATEEVGKIGLAFNIMGLFASTIVGYALSKLQHYRTTTVTVFVLYLVGMILFTLAPLYSLTAVYVTSVVLGFFMTAAFSICLEVAAELTYPVPESTSTGYLLASAELMGIIFVYLYSFMLYNFGAFWSNVVTSVELLISTVLIVCMKFERKRQNVEERHHNGVQKQT